MSRHALAGVLVLLLLASIGRQAASEPTKWTIFVYMLADNNLEPFALWDLEEIMAAMTTERPGDCVTTQCGADCPVGKVLTYKTTCPTDSNSFQQRCCSASSYPDVFIMVDKGQGSTLAQSDRGFDLPYADYRLLETVWTSAKTLIALPGGQWQQLTEEEEVDMASAQTIKSFLQEGFNRFPPSGSRKYMAVFWDHGNGWLGYGADATCEVNGAYNDYSYCHIANLQTLMQGLNDGLSSVTDLRTNQRMKLDVIGFDACLMSMYEVSSALAPYTNYLLGSELLEPGTGWDYSALGNLVLGLTASGANADPSNGFSEKDLADLVIQGYVATPRVSGLTLALTDLSKVVGSLEPSVSALSSTLTNQMATTPAVGMQVLQQRTLLGLIDGAADNVDLGALLTRLSAVLTGTLKTQARAALSAYNASVLAFQRDGVLADGTGMAVYFPPNSYSMDNTYPTFVDADATALSNWLAFLRGLYSAVNAIGTTTGLAFQESYAVPYWAVDTKTWITHGTLTTLTGLTADLMYGFISPTGTDYIIAGTTAGVISQYAAVGAWSGKLFGLVQDLVANDGVVDGLALAYADEQRLTDAEGNVQQLTLQMQVQYAKSCSAALSDMTPGMLKYTLDMSSGKSSLQLFVNSGANKAWGEVAPASGGVIIPYLSAIDLTGQVPGKGSSYGYSDCLKWGYQGSIMVATFNATQAVGILGLDLTRDLATMLTVKAINGRVRALYGAFEPAQKTQAGCQCAQQWSYQDGSSNVVVVQGQCVNPFGHARAWCQYEPESCTGTPTHVDNQTNTDFCAPVTTLSGCQCHPNWRLSGTAYYGTCASTGDPLGSWCVVDRSTCPTAYRAHQFGPNDTVAATIGTNTTQLTGLDFDYCQVVTNTGCSCSNTWEYGGTRYSGTCRTGLFGTSTVPGIDVDSTWCFVDKPCSQGKRLDGFTYDLCTPEGGRVTESGVPCQLPVSYHGVQLYNCISYNHSTPGVATPKPWCFTDLANNQWGYCAPWTCTAALKANCPAGSPTSNLTSWAAPACLETLCNARKDLANISLCTQDSQADKDRLVTAYSSLAGSTAFGQLLGNTSTPGSLDAYCSQQFGYLCMDSILDPACPGLFRQNNTWMASTNKDQLCDMGCLKALCRLQQQANVNVTGSGGPGASTSPSITCADSELTTSVMWTLMKVIDTTCGLPGPAILSCNRLLSPPQLCAPSTQLTAAAGNISDGAPPGGTYSPSTQCTWTINIPLQPYISLNFSSFKTEPTYDVVTVEDFDGLIGRFSGTDLPPGVSTDTGLIRVNFTSDGSLQNQGFASQYLASATPQVAIPTCDSGQKLLQVVLRTRAYGSELSWVVAKRSLLNLVFAPTPNEQNMVMAGGLLPAAVRSKVPNSVLATAQTDYRDYRSYYAYACLDVGGYNLFTYDSYGDGWEGGRITLTQVVNATTGCVLLSSTGPRRSNATTQFSVAADADTSSSACSALTSPSGSYYYVEAGLVVLAEDTSTFTLAKQRKLKEALAALLNMDASQVIIQSLANATSGEITKGLDSQAAPATSSSKGGAGSNAAAHNTAPHTSKRKLAAAAGGKDELTAAAAGQNEATIQHMLQQQRSLLGYTSEGGSRLRALSGLAVGVDQYVASGEWHAAEQRLLQAAQRLDEQQQQQAASAAGSVASGGSVERPEEQEEEEEGSSYARKLQQLLTLTSNGTWQDATASVTASDASNSTGSTGSSNSSDSSSGSAATEEGASPNSNNSSSNVGSVSTDLSAVLQEKPLGTSAGVAPPTGPVNSKLVQQLQAQLSNGTQQPLKSKAWGIKRSRGKGGLPLVTISKSPAQAFMKQPLRSSAAAGKAPLPSRAFAAASSSSSVGSSAGRSAGGSGNADVALSPATKGAWSGASATVASANDLSFVPQAMPMLLHATSTTQTGDNNETFLLFDAVRPGRALTQIQDSSSSSGSGDSLSSSSGGGGDNSGSLLIGGGAGRTAVMLGPTQIDPEVLAGIVAAGREGPRGTPRPRPGLDNWSSQSSTGTGTRRRLSSSSSRARAKELQQGQQLEAGSAVVPFVQQHEQPHELWHLLQAPAPNQGVTVVVRVNGYADAAAASAASLDLQSMVTNGTLVARLASQGWTGVSIGLLYVSTGSVGPWNNPNLLRIIIGACVGGAALAALIGVAVYIRRRRQAGSAQPPAAQQRPGSTQPLGPGPRMSSHGPPGGPAYYSPQQAAAVVVPYPVSPYSRTASPSAPLLLTPSQQAALTAGASPQGAGSPYGRGPRTSMMPPGYSYPSVAPPGTYSSPMAVAGSFSGPFPPSSWQQAPSPSQQQQQQQHYPPLAQLGSGAAAGRSSPSSFTTQQPVVTGYPVIPPPR